MAYIENGIILNGKQYLRIRYGSEKTDWDADNKTCHDCGAVKGELHRDGCDVEECPACYGQAISCDCKRGEMVVVPKDYDFRSQDPLCLGVVKIHLTDYKEPIHILIVRERSWFSESRQETQNITAENIQQVYYDLLTDTRYLIANKNIFYIGQKMIESISDFENYCGFRINDDGRIRLSEVAKLNDIDFSFDSY